MRPALPTDSIPPHDLAEALELRLGGGPAAASGLV
jgi:hypothetical protein